MTISQCERPQQSAAHIECGTKRRANSKKKNGKPKSRQIIPQHTPYGERATTNHTVVFNIHCGLPQWRISVVIIYVNHTQGSSLNLVASTFRFFSSFLFFDRNLINYQVVKSF